jgi:hydroxyacylglutathione hydrolase
MGAASRRPARENAMSERVRLHVEGFPVGPLQSNAYLVWDEETRHAVLVDPGMESEPILPQIRLRDLSVVALLNTHGHFDHVYNNGFFKESLGCPIFIHPGDLEMLKAAPEQASAFGFEGQASPPPDGLLKEGVDIPVGQGLLKVLHTPGHSPGGVCFYSPDFLLSGDTLFAQSVGRTDLPGGSHEILLKSIGAKLLTLPDVTTVLPGHGPSSSIRHEKRHNPFLQGLGGAP